MDEGRCQSVVEHTYLGERGSGQVVGCKCSMLVGCIGGDGGSVPGRQSFDDIVDLVASCMSDVDVMR